MVFTNYYGQPSCTPGRAAIQTGRIPNRSGMTTIGHHCRFIDVVREDDDRQAETACNSPDIALQRGARKCIGADSSSVWRSH